MKVEATPTVAADIDAGASLRVLSLDVILPYTATDVAAFALGGVEVADGPAGLSCYPSADDLLFSHHKLRC